MKNILIFFLVLFSVTNSIGQSVIQRTPGTNTVVDPRWGATINMFIPRYIDTIQANIPSSLGIDSAGAEIYTYTGNIVWIRGSNPKRWIAIGTGTPSSTGDTLFAELPAFFDSLTRSPSTILKILRGNGIVSGGTVTVDSCNTLDVIATIISLNYQQYSSAATRLTVPANGSAFPRVDEVIDSLGTIVLRTGTPSSTPVGMPYNSATEVVLASYEMQGMASCVDINQIIVWDENLGTPNEFTLSLAGTISANGDNTDNPFHLLKAIFVSTYSNGSLIFTSASPLTASAGEIFKFWIYLNGAFGSNQIQIQFFLGSTPIGNPLAFGTGYGFNPNDSNEYQQVVPPLSAFNITNQSFDKIVITFNGDDLSGAKGLYIDYVQLQNGATNFGSGNGVIFYGPNASNDSTILITESGIRYAASKGGGSGGTGGSLQDAFDTSVARGDNPTIDLNDNQFKIYDNTGYNNTFFNLQNTSNRWGFGNVPLEIDQSISDTSIEYLSSHNFFDGDMFINTVPSGSITDSVLTRNPITGMINMRDASSFGSNVTADNGLTKVSSTIELGSTTVADNGLLHDTHINGHDLYFLTLDSLFFNTYSNAGSSYSQLESGGSVVFMQANNTDLVRGTSVTVGVTNIEIDPRTSGSVGFVKLLNTVNSQADSLDVLALDTVSTNVYRKRISITGGTVTSVAALTLGTTGADLSSSVANSTTTPVITLNVPTASASNRGALSAADWTTFNNKQNTITTNKLRVTATGGQTAFTFAGLPTSTNDYDIFVNGAYVNPTFYSGSGTTVTFSSGLQVGDIVDFAEKK